MSDTHIESVPFRAVERLAAAFHDPLAQRAVWKGAAGVRRLAADTASSPDEYRYQMQLARAYEQRAEQITTEVP